MNLIDLTKEKGLKTEEDCIAYIEKLRWPGGICCPACRNQKISRFQSRGKTGKVRRLYQCLEKACRYQFSATTGTIFHDSHLPLSKWFTAVRLVSDSKEEISANQLRHALGIQYKTARHVLNRVREALQKGTVEVPETPAGISDREAYRPPSQPLLIMPKRKAILGNRAAKPARDGVLAASGTEGISRTIPVSNGLSEIRSCREAPPTTIDNMLIMFTSVMEMTVRPPLFWFNYLRNKVSLDT